MAGRRRLPLDPVVARIESLNHDGRGVAHIEGKATFVLGGLPGETVRLQYLRRHRRLDEGRVLEVLEAAPERVEPRCAHFGRCGGCSLQHMAAGAQIHAKQQVLLESLRHIGGIGPEGLLEPLSGPAWGYRYKARLGVKYVEKKGRVLVGFREPASSKLAELERCEILHPAVGPRLGELAELIMGLGARDQIAQIELAAGDEQVALVFRNLVGLGERDRRALIGYAEASGLHLYLQPGGPDSLELLHPQVSRLGYALPEEGLEYRFGPLDFTQVNPALNRAMVAQAMRLLEPRPGERALDLYCGLGNFTLPLARRCREVVGVEGEPGLVARAGENAARNGLENAGFRVADLSRLPEGPVPWLEGGYDLVLLDPPRSGAAALIEPLGRLGAPRLLYVSCNPATLARDAGELVRGQGYRLVRAGVMDMFPHTGHLESMALFAR